MLMAKTPTKTAPKCPARQPKTKANDKPPAKKDSQPGMMQTGKIKNGNGIGGMRSMGKKLTSASPEKPSLENFRGF